LRLLKVKVKPNSKRSKVVEEGDTLVVWVKAPAREGRANDELLDVLADYLNVPKSSLRIVRGMRSRSKIVSVG